MSGHASWVLCPADGKAHLLAVESAHGVLLTTPCGRSLPSGILQHDRLPSRQLCPECVAAYLLPAPVFARLTPAGRRSSGPVRSPGGQPVSDLAQRRTPVCGWPAPVLPRWARCPVDRHLHLLAPAEAAAAEIDGHGRAGCGRLIPRAGLTIGGPATGFCLGCMAVGTAW